MDCPEWLWRLARYASYFLVAAFLLGPTIGAIIDLFSTSDVQWKVERNTETSVGVTMSLCLMDRNENLRLSDDQPEAWEGQTFNEASLTGEWKTLWSLIVTKDGWTGRCLYDNGHCLTLQATNRPRKRETLVVERKHLRSTKKVVLSIHDKQACASEDDEILELEGGTSSTIIVTQEIVDISETKSNCNVCLQRYINLVVVKTDARESGSKIDLTTPKFIHKEARTGYRALLWANVVNLACIVTGATVKGLPFIWKKGKGMLQHCPCFKFRGSYDLEMAERQ